MGGKVGWDGGTRGEVRLWADGIRVLDEFRIAVTNQPGSNARAVAEIVLGLTINTLRRVVELDRRLRRGELLPNIDWMAETVDDKVVGLVGMGDM